MEYSKLHKMICFSRDELEKLFKEAKTKDLHNELSRHGLNLHDLGSDHAKMEEITDKLSAQGAADREEHEVFVALFIMLNFYDQKAEICFELNQQLDESIGIQDLKTLNKYREGTDTDFIIRTDVGFRKFQLKRYPEKYIGKLEHKNLMNFIEKTIGRYGSIQDTNLLIILQPKDLRDREIDFEYIHQNLAKKGYTFTGQILLTYNENNVSSVLIQVYPELKQMNIPFDPRQN